MFAEVRRAYLRSLYDALRYSFETFVFSANATLDALSRTLDLLPWRHCTIITGNTYEWLLSRLTEEFARNTFFRLFEYVRLNELASVAADHEDSAHDGSSSEANRTSVADATTKSPASDTSPHRETGRLWRDRCESDLRNALAHLHRSRQRASNATALSRVLRSVSEVLTCARITETVVTASIVTRNEIATEAKTAEVLDDAVTRLMRAVVSSAGLTRVARKRVASSHPRAVDDSDDDLGEAGSVAMSSAHPAWNLTLNRIGEIDIACRILRGGGGSGGGGDTGDRSSRVEDLSDAIQSDEYFSLYKDLALWDRRLVRADFNFYSEIFSALSSEILTISAEEMGWVID